MKYYFILILLLIVTSCAPEGVKKETKKPVSKTKAKSEKEQIIKTVSVDSSGRIMKFDNGLEIHWVEEGEGDAFGEGKLIDVDYAVYLESGKKAHSTAQFGLVSVPFMIGFNMQTKGWDLALAQLKVGDSAEVKIPAKLGRGEKGYWEMDAKTGQRKEIIPANANLILKVRVVAERKPTKTVDGNKVWKLYGNKNSSIAFDEGKEIEFSCSGYTVSKRNIVNTQFAMRLEDSGVVPGLKKALIGAKKADRLLVLVPSKEAYGSKGYLDLIKPNEDIFYSVFVTDVR